MRALCASIITAGALIGLGLTALGLGMRYQGLGLPRVDKLHQLDTAMLLILVVLLASVVVGMAAAFLGLAYHHERRHHERQYRLKGESLGSRVGE